jgi:hypothetical protein
MIFGRLSSFLQIFYAIPVFRANNSWCK